MRIVREQDWITLSAPAKINLFLEVLAKRPDGFHEIETLMAAVEIYDTLRLRWRADGELRLTSHWATPDEQYAAELGDIPTGAGNIIIRALSKLRDKAGVQRGADVTLTKRIASAAGLGGASSDAAAALLAANFAWQLNWSRDQLAIVAAELGSDIPFFLGEPVALCRGRGEQIETLATLPVLDLVIVRPPVGLSTPAVYKACRPALRPAAAVPLVEAWRRGDIAGVGRQLTNRLQPAAESLSPWIERLAQNFSEQGCYGHQMSGSGSSYFGICRHAKHARQVARRLRARRLGFVYCTRTCGSLKADNRQEDSAARPCCAAPRE